MKSLFNKYYNFFFLIIIIIYNIVPKKLRPFLLLIVSLTFFFLLSSYLLLFLLITIITIYLAGLGFDHINKQKEKELESSEEKKLIKEKYQKKKKLVLVICILINVSFLFVFKYLNFFTINTNYLLNTFHIKYNFQTLNLIAPIGISFYTLQALSYLLDVYNGKIEPDKNPFRIALFVSFFPQVVEGPIGRYSDTAIDLYKGEKITYKNMCNGFQRILWGLFKKMIIADRLNILVTNVFDGYLNYGGFICFIGALSYTIMLYMEFSGTMDMIIGIGEIFGLKLPENFNQPFFSKNISEFWTRWHISLGAWFRDYIYYPVSLSKPMKKLTKFSRKIVGNYFGPLLSGTCALAIVWFLNGLWHGAGWTFLLFGLYHFILISIDNILEPIVNNFCLKHKINRLNIFYRIFQFLKLTFLIVIGELIFNAASVDVAFTMINKIFTNIGNIGDISHLGLDIYDFIITIIAIIIVFIIGLIREKNIDIREEISKKPIWLRWTIYYALIFSIIIFGAYGPNYTPISPIYVDF